MLFFPHSGLSHACYLLMAPSVENCSYGLSDPTLVISFVPHRIPVVILIKEPGLGKLAINDNVLINSYKSACTQPFGRPDIGEVLLLIS